MLATKTTKHELDDDTQVQNVKLNPKKPLTKTNILH